jgi:hypothetical protein
MLQTEMKPLRGFIPLSFTLAISQVSFAIPWS